LQVSLISVFVREHDQFSILNLLPCQYSPGGGRIWPSYGFWSYSEYQLPIACPISSSCPGVNASTASISSANPQANYVDTQVCSSGYTGSLCITCADSYFILNSRCYPCQDSTDQTRTIVLTLLIALLLLALLAAAVATLRAMRLALVIQLFLIIQTLALQLVDGVRDSPHFTEQLSTAASYINWINFDVAIIKSGCGGMPSFTFVRKVQLNVALMALAMLFFSIALCVRAIMRVRSEARLLSDSELNSSQLERNCSSTPQLSVQEVVHSPPRIVESPPSTAVASRPITAVERNSALGVDVLEVWVEFKERLAHAVIVLLSIFYLRVTLLSLLAFSCTPGPDPVMSRDSAEQLTYSLYLSEDMQVRSEEGSNATRTSK
jgi:hypothetical protein